MKLVFILTTFLTLYNINLAQTDISKEKRLKISQAALSIVNPDVVYDPQYYRLEYPGGDLPADRGVCTDVIIRTYRKLGVDLQVLVHKDMKKHFDLYPTRWGLKHPDKNIDHRRVPNLMTFFKRFGKTLPVSDKPADYQPGDIVVWDLGNGILHIGVVVNRKTAGGIYKVVHNIGGGQVVEDVLFSWKIIGHYFYDVN